jgi:DNA (cytosine-5)-methyltransferase 1
VSATFATLFSGIGGDALGLERAGWTPLWFSEVTPTACDVLAARWPEVPNLGDIRMIDWSTVDRPDLLAGGFPCQDISNAHTASPRLGLDGFKSGLWRHYLDAIRTLRPRWVLVENVSAFARWVPEVRADLAYYGYASLPVELSAGSFGAPHKRPRIFVVADANSEGESLLALDEEVARLRPLPRGGRDWRCPPPGGFRVAHGLPGGMDRLHALGNSVVPAAVEWIARQLTGQPGESGVLMPSGSPEPATTSVSGHDLSRSTGADPSRRVGPERRPS